MTDAFKARQTKLFAADEDAARTKIARATEDAVCETADRVGRAGDVEVDRLQEVSEVVRKRIEEALR